MGNRGNGFEGSENRSPQDGIERTLDSDHIELDLFFYSIRGFTEQQGQVDRTFDRDGLIAEPIERCLIAGIDLLAFQVHLLVGVVVEDVNRTSPVNQNLPDLVLADHGVNDQRILVRQHNILIVFL